MADLLARSYLHELFDYREDGSLIRRNARKHCQRGKPVGWKNSSGHIQTEIAGKAYLVHRLVFLLHRGWMPQEIDHINRIKTDNRIENLRAVTRSENLWNKDAQTVRGAYRLPSGRWQSSIGCLGKQHYLGAFDTKDQARQAYLAAKEQLHIIRPQEMP